VLLGFGIAFRHLSSESGDIVMPLSDGTIIKRVNRQGGLEIIPFSPGQLQPASYDVKLSGEYRDLEGEHWQSSEHRMIPGEFLLAATEEWFRIPDNMIARIEGKSSWGRKGLIVHATAGFIDPGFEGNLTLEMANLAHRPIVLQKGALIAQLSFDLLDIAALRPYGHPLLGSHYQGDRGPQPSAL
jgi:dCTP deaminase